MQRDLLEMAAERFGVFRRDDAFAAGLSRQGIQTRLGSGLWVPEHPGIYRVAGAPSSFEQAVMAACLAGGDATVASHSAAAALWNLATIEPHVDITIAPDRRRQLQGVRVHRSPVDAVDRTTTCGIPVTTPARTLIDYARVVPRWEAENALEAGLDRRLFTCLYIAKRLEALGRQGRKGAAVVASLLAERPTEWVRAESRLERRILREFANHGLPRPVLQFEIPLPRRKPARVDICYPPERLIVEGDSYRFHVHRRDWVRNQTRNRMLEAIGYGIIPITWYDLDERLEETMNIVRTALATRAPRRSET